MLKVLGPTFAPGVGARPIMPSRTPVAPALRPDCAWWSRPHLLCYPDLLSKIAHRPVFDPAAHSFPEIFFKVVHPYDPDTFERLLAKHDLSSAYPLLAFQLCHSFPLGDIFVDITLGAFGIFIKYTAHWVEWTGIKKCTGRQTLAKAAHPPLFHPQNEKLTIWCTSQDVLWVPRTTLGGNHGDVFRQHPGQSFVSAREMIEEMSVLAQKIADMYGGEWKRKL